MGEYFFYDRHFLEKSDGNATIYYWLSDITSREEGIEKNEVFSKYMKPFAGRYQKENASDGSNSEINLLADSIFITNLNINFLDKEGNIINGGSDFIQCDEDGNLIVISSSYESYRITSYNVCYTKLLRIDDSGSNFSVLLVIRKLTQLICAFPSFNVK